MRPWSRELGCGGAEMEVARETGLAIRDANISSVSPRRDRPGTVKAADLRTNDDLTQKSTPCQSRRAIPGNAVRAARFSMRGRAAARRPAQKHEGRNERQREHREQPVDVVVGEQR